MSDFRQNVQQLQRLEENKTCIDCGVHNPQWASVSFGTFFCLECSGQHRSLGVHISFVRSVTMDAWKEEQYTKMKMGGNGKAREFFKTYGIDGLPIRAKYHTKAADLYREKLAADCAGLSFEMPRPSPDLAVPNLPNSQATESSSSTTPGVIPVGQKAQTEHFFRGKLEQNQTRPENLPPSQGGRYAGFGNTPVQPQTAPERDPADLLNDTFSVLSKGFSMFSTKALEVARTAGEQAVELGKGINDSVIKPAAEKMQDPAIRVNLSSTFNSLLTTTDMGLSYLANAIIGDEANKSPAPGQTSSTSDTAASYQGEHNLNKEDSTTSNEPVPNETKLDKPAGDWQVDDAEWEKF